MSGTLGSVARIGLTVAATAYFGPVGGFVAACEASVKTFEADELPDPSSEPAQAEPSDVDA